MEITFTDQELRKLAKYVAQELFEKAGSDLMPSKKVGKQSMQTLLEKVRKLHEAKFGGRWDQAFIRSVYAMTGNGNKGSLTVMQEDHINRIFKAYEGEKSEQSDQR